MKKEEAIEKYEALATDLRAQLDAKSAHVNRLAMENRELRNKTIPVLEGLLTTLSTNEGHRYYRLAQAIAQVLDGAPLGTVNELGDAWCESVLEKVSSLKQNVAAKQLAAVQQILNEDKVDLELPWPPLVMAVARLMDEVGDLRAEFERRKKKNKSARRRANARAVRAARKRGR